MTSKLPQGLPRQRSKAIAIKRSRPAGEKCYCNNNATEKAAQGGDADMYDYATWRMYNRITDHRRKNLLLRSSSQQQRERSSTKNSKCSYESSSSSSCALCANDSSSSPQSSPSSPSRGERKHPHPHVVHPVSSSSVVHGQRYYLHQHVPYEYSSADYRSCSEDYDEIFDLEL